MRIFKNHSKLMTVYFSITIILAVLLFCSTAYYLVKAQQSTQKIKELSSQLFSVPKYAVGSPVYVFVAGKWIQDIIIESKLSDTVISIRTKSMEVGTFYPITSEYVRLSRNGEDVSETIDTRES
nr:MAG TPA: hypothetical protein [Caudoviricetes sp.]